MKVIILNIPHDTMLEEILKFTRSGAGFPFRFFHKTKILKCEILDIYDKAKHSNESHGVVTFAEQSDANRVIHNLNNKLFKGEKVRVKAYQNRSASDQRFKSLAQGNPRPVEQRREKLEIHTRDGDTKPQLHALYNPAPDHLSPDEPEPEPDIETVAWENVLKREKDSSWKKR